ncbi:F-box protein PP2-B10-like [Cucumis melo var. makuwa]|uniref:F-box protein PP2-B10-like n=1 Tax=Cucumis melo var. makuwa TaxID=1194695 RepID=A0A5D3CDA9_CUCMM|nr:F-box protein PP2-B10-like [Cucumis melo var. makuwa]
MEGEEKGKATFSDFSSLPEGVVAKILSLTTPPDACVLSAVSKTFHAAAQSDVVWNEFLPADWELLISRLKPNKLKFDPVSSPKKDIFFSLCYFPVLIDDGNKSFSLEKWTGKKCIMLGARDLSITWGENSDYWTWEDHPDSRFAEVAVLIYVWWLEIRGRLSCRMLSPKTVYAVYFVFNIEESSYYGFNIDPPDATVGILGHENHPKSVCLDPYLDQPRQRQRQRRAPWERRPQSEHMPALDRPHKRHDGWFEIELGEFISGDDVDDELEMALKEVKGSSSKGGLVVEGIEIRPKKTHRP